MLGCIMQSRFHYMYGNVPSKIPLHNTSKVNSRQEGREDSLDLEAIELAIFSKYHYVLYPGT